MSFRWERAWRVPCRSWSREIKIRGLAFREYSVERFRIWWSIRDLSFRWERAWRMTCRSWSGQIKIRSLAFKKYII
jgi:hypothetical protein